MAQKLREQGDETEYSVKPQDHAVGTAPLLVTEPTGYGLPKLTSRHSSAPPLGRAEYRLKPEATYCRNGYRSSATYVPQFYRPYLLRSAARPPVLGTRDTKSSALNWPS